MLLGEIGLAGVAAHPGYRLRVQTLGAFRVWRGEVEVEPREWQRGKARQLFQLLLTERGHRLQREEIVERLWPQLPPEVASRDFKVALNALKEAIEPTRGAEGVSAYIDREGPAYRLRTDADLWLDCEVFERECQEGLIGGDVSGQIERLSKAVGLYGGPFLPDALYDDWASDERGRLLSLFLRAGDKLAVLLLESGAYVDALAVCDRLLAQDICWEGAYRTMILAHHRQGDRALALRAYTQCAQVLKSELGMEPSAETEAARQLAMSGE
jgi:DNA-binding SARP family transcriptional activator